MKLARVVGTVVLYLGVLVVWPMAAIVHGALSHGPGSFLRVFADPAVHRALGRRSARREAAQRGESYFPYEYFYRLLEEGLLAPHYQIPLEHCWLNAARERQIPIYAPGFEDMRRRVPSVDKIQRLVGYAPQGRCAALPEGNS